LKKFIILILFLHSISFATCINDLYFMPEDGKKAERKLFYLLSHAKKDIKMVIYTFTNKKLSQALKISARKGVKIEIIADKKEAFYKNSTIPKLALLKNFKIYLLSGKKYRNGDKAKMHVKMTIIDNKYLIIGSANYSFSAFYKNYEYIIISREKYLIDNFMGFFNHLKTIATNYRLAF